MFTKDELLQQDVLDELSYDPRVDAANIGVTVHDGSVTLTGHVDSFAEKYAAERAVRKVKGVLSLADEIKVHLPDSARYDDADIAERVAHVISFNISVPADAIFAKVTSGRVILEGEVPWHYQRKTLEEQIAHVRGVTSVTNLVKIEPKASPDDVEDRIEKALKRNADIEADRIKVHVDGGRVTLDGSVKARYERELVESAAWAAPGVTEVIDHLRIG